MPATAITHLKGKSCVQVYLAPTPATAQCLTTQERVWLQKRQDEAIAARTESACHSSVKGASVKGPSII